MELTRLKGIGPKIAARLRDTEIRTAADLLMLVPRRYEGRAAAIPIGEIGTASSATVIGTIVGAGTPWRTGRGQRFAQVKLRDDTGEITAIFFGAPARGVRQIFTPGRRVQFSGDVKIVKGLPVLQHPDYVLLDADVRGGGEEIFPVYARVAGFGRKQLTSFIRAALDCSAGKLTDALPYEMEPFAGLPPIGDALRQIHAPSPDTDINSLNQFKTPAHRRMILDELFFVQLGLLMRRNIGRRGRAEPMREIGAMEKSVRAALPYRLTNAQEAVLSRIKSDLAAPRPMHRLLQGDVGCGKTIVAFLAACMVAENAGQSALMAPTEILARQHYENLSEPAAAAGLSIALLTSGTSIPDRHELVPRVLTGEIDLVIGTHALLSSTLRFPRLRLAVIDEQHRFGVVQRARLADTDLLPHVLVMSATPIPRSLAMTVFGDLDVSVIREKPPGRLTTETQWLIDADAAYGLLKQKLETGDRAFVVCPLVDESASVASAAAVPVFKELSRTRLRGFRLGLVHGRMTEMEKHAALTSFAAGETQVLVASSIVEVGVDVPEAGVMLVDGAERFGLSQLHQLRGRVGRSSRRGLCLLLTGADIGPKAEHRMRALVTGDDGFKIAEEDLAIRGPGDILGTRQHGLPALRWASLARDIELVEEARAAAKKLLERDPDLSAHPKAARLLAYRWGKLLELGNIG